MKKQLLFIILTLLPMVASADAVEINGIYYNLILEGNVAEVTSNPNKYTGTIVIPESVTYENVNYIVTCIGNYAFYECTDLTSITIPNSVTSILSYAFYGCTGLTSVNIPNSVTNIEFGTFAYCYLIQTITLGSGITSIGSDAFSNCIHIKDLYCYADKVPSTDSYAFINSYIENSKLHVPKASINDYKTETPWKNFGSIVTLTDDDPKPDATRINVVRSTENNKSVIYDLNGVRQFESQKGLNIINGNKYLKK